MSTPKHKILVHEPTTKRETSETTRIELNTFRLILSVGYQKMSSFNIYNRCYKRNVDFGTHHLGATMDLVGMHIKQIVQTKILLPAR